MLERYEPNFTELSIPQTMYLATAIQRRNPSFNAAEGGEYESGVELMHHADAYGLDQADVVMSLSNDPSPVAVEIIETLINPSKIQRPARGTTTQSKTQKTRGPRKPKTDPRVITHVSPNPKREGSASHTRYELYTQGDTVDQAIAKGLTRGDINHDSAKGFIKLGEAS